MPRKPTSSVSSWSPTTPASCVTIKPDIVHVFADGHFIKTGGPELADELEETGYDAYLPEGSDSESALA